MSENILSRLANSLPIRWGYFKKDGQPQKVIFVGHEKAIYGADGVQLDNKLTSIKDSLSDAFSEDKAYTVGQYCIYLNRLYKFTEDKAEGLWDGGKVIPTSISEELGALNSSNSTKEDILWSNPNTSALFPSTSIAIDLSDYSFVYVQLNMSTNYKYITTYVCHTAGTHIASSSTISSDTRYPLCDSRYITFSQNGVNIGDNEHVLPGQLPQTNNAYLIPVQIIGVRK